MDMTKEDYAMVESVDGSMTDVLSMVTTNNTLMHRQMSATDVAIFNQVATMLLVSMWRLEKQRKIRFAAYSRLHDWRKVDEECGKWHNCALNFSPMDEETMNRLGNQFKAWPEYYSGGNFYDQKVTKHVSSGFFSGTSHIFDAYYCVMELIRERASKRMLILTENY